MRLADNDLAPHLAFPKSSKTLLLIICQGALHLRYTNAIIGCSYVSDVAIDDLSDGYEKT